MSAALIALRINDVDRKRRLLVLTVRTCGHRPFFAERHDNSAERLSAEPSAKLRR